MNKYVICDDGDTHGFIELIKGTIYEVEYETKYDYYVQNYLGQVKGYSKDRFRMIKEKESDNMKPSSLETLKELEQKVEDIGIQIKQLKKELHKGEEENKKKWWKPKIGGSYWYIDLYGEINNTSCNKIPNKYIETGNVFQTKEQVERELFERQLRFKLKKFAFENNEEEIDWNDGNQEKYYIVNDYYNNSLDFRKVIRIRVYNNQIYFTSQEVVEKAIETFKDDLMRYFTTDK